MRTLLRKIVTPILVVGVALELVATAIFVGADQQSVTLRDFGQKGGTRFSLQEDSEGILRPSAQELGHSFSGVQIIDPKNAKPLGFNSLSPAGSRVGSVAISACRDDGTRVTSPDARRFHEGATPLLGGSEVWLDEDTKGVDSSDLTCNPLPDIGAAPGAGSLGGP